MQERTTMVNNFQDAPSAIIPADVVKVFQEGFELNYAPDGQYSGVISEAYYTDDFNNKPRVNIKVNFKDSSGHRVALKRVFNFVSSNYRLINLFNSFNIDYMNSDEISLESLINRKVNFEVKNNGPYCNVDNIKPDGRNRISPPRCSSHEKIEIIEVEVPYDDGDFDIDIDIDLED